MLIQLSENISSHICHELANSIGALDSNLEFLGSESLYAKEALEIVKQASAHSVNKLRYFRQLYGSNARHSNLGELVKLAECMFKGAVSKLKFNSNGFDNMHLDIIPSKLLLSFIYIAHGDLPYGGFIDIEISPESGSEIYQIRVSSNSEKLKPRPNINKILVGLEPLEEMSPRNVIAYYVKYLTDKQPDKFKIIMSPQKIDYIFTATNVIEKL
jgi:hypothetical protein